MQPFEEFAKVERLQQNITISEKIHGTNAQILIMESATPQHDKDLAARNGCVLSDSTFTVMVGSRTRWIKPDDDNYGFAAWVHQNVNALFAALGPGQHFGEWYGRGINAGYGLPDRRFALFNTHRWTEPKAQGLLPDGVDVVPVLYSGPFITTILDETMDRLRESGSVLVPGYMKPEGIVVRFDRSHVLMKRTFESEDEAWSYKKDRPPRQDLSEIEVLCAPYWQPFRLEKLLSRDERFARDYPASLPHIVSAYIHDLTTETPDLDESVAKLVKKGAFKAIKAMLAERGMVA